MRPPITGLVAFVLAAVVGGVWAQEANVGLVNALQGDVNYYGKEGQVRKAQPFMRLRHGDKVTLASGASIRISYLTVSRQESWLGPSSFVMTSTGGELLKGSQPDVVNLPAVVPQKLARVSELMNPSHGGGTVLRSVKAQTSATQEEVAQAMAAYESMRAKALPSDVTPELFLYSVFEENGMTDDLKIVARDMLSRQPDNPEIQRLVKVALGTR